MAKLLERKLESNNGLWRSLVAHLTGGQGAAGSNPVNPTRIRKPDIMSGFFVSLEAYRDYGAKWGAEVFEALIPRLVHQVD